MRFYGFVAGVFLLSGCGSAPESTGSDPVSSLQLNLTTTAASGARYRLGPATFNITGGFGSGGGEQWTLNATGDEPSLHLPLPAGGYNVELQPDWTLSRLEGTTATPVVATLLSQPKRFADVRDFETTPVDFAFRLGESGIDIGVTVDEGIPEGYDGRVVGGPTSYQIEWRGGGFVCCFSSFEQAQQEYGNAHLLPPP